MFTLNAMFLEERHKVSNFLMLIVVIVVRVEGVYVLFDGITNLPGFTEFSRDSVQNI